MSYSRQAVTRHASAVRPSREPAASVNGRPEAPLVTVEGLCKQFGAQYAVRNLDLDIRRGEIVGLVGPSGCGKTTTLRSIAGLETPDAGRITIDGETVVDTEAGLLVPSEKRRLGMVFQSYALWPHMTVYQNVAFPLRVRRVKRDEIQTRVASALELVGLADAAARPATKLSGGQQQRVALARALVYEPHMLLLDEALSNLDTGLRERMRREIRKLQRNVGTTMLFVTHDQEEALSLADRIAVMSGGRIEQFGTPRDLYERPATPFVRDFLGKVTRFPAVIRLAGQKMTAEVRSNDSGNRRTPVPLSETQVAKLAGAADGDEIILAARPEDVAIVPPEAVTDNDVIGTVESVLFVGDHCEYQVRFGSHVCELWGPRSPQHPAGSRVGLRLPLETLQAWKHDS